MTLVLGALLLASCTAVRREPGAQDGLAPQCRWRPVSYRMGMDSVLVTTDSVRVCRGERAGTPWKLVRE